MKISVEANVTGHEAVIIAKVVNPLKGLPDLDQLREKINAVKQDLDSLGNADYSEFLPNPEDLENHLAMTINFNAPFPIDIETISAEAELGDVYGDKVAVEIGIPIPKVTQQKQ